MPATRTSGCGLRVGGDGLIGNERRGARPAPRRAHGHQGSAEPKVLAVVREKGGHHGDHRFDGGPSGRSDAGYGWHTARGGGGLQGALGRSTPREAQGTDA
jgi:hypothetical protein